MGTLRNLFERFGFVRLRDFGLLLTADRRVVTTRSTVLDDGYGGCIVGWTESDLAAMELPRWRAEPPAAPAAPKRPPPRLMRAAPAPVPPAPSAPTPAPIAAPTPSPNPPLTDEEWDQVIAAARTRASVAPALEDEWESEIAAARTRAPEPEPEPAPPVEDEWEWEIVAARARASVDDVPPAEPDWDREIAIARAAVADAARKTQTCARPVAADPRQPRTVVPVPSLPSIDPQLVRSYEAARRFPRGTSRHLTPPRTSSHTTRR